MLNKDYTIVSFPTHRDSLKKFKKLHPEYGALSEILRSLFKMYLDGKIRVSKPLP